MYFIRHGQSQFNIVHDRLGRDPGVPDAPLTDLGFAQARRAADELAGRGVKEIISSPYTRALQTAQVIAETLEIPHHVEPLIGERAIYSCDIGSPVSNLRAAWDRLDFSHVTEEKWWPETGEGEGAVNKRITAFKKKWKDRLAGGDVALVSHWYFLSHLTGKYLSNGEVLFKELF